MNTRPLDIGDNPFRICFNDIDDSSSFDRWPAFGRPCVTYTCIFEKMPKERRGNGKHKG